MGDADQQLVPGDQSTFECPPCVAWARATPGIQTAASPRTTASHLADWDFMTPVQLAVS